MLFKSGLVTQASGSLGGMTASHNSGGMYLRARSIPTNPATALQLNVKNAMSALVTRWTEVLTETQRESWRNYAANVLVTNPLGDSVARTGQNWFIACNAPRVQAEAVITNSGLPIVDSAPTMYNRGTFTTPTFLVDDVSGIDIMFNENDDWVEEADAAMFIYQGMPKNTSRKFFKGPFRYIGSIAGAPITPPTSPVTFSIANIATAGGYTIAGNQNYWLAVAVARADGRLSTRSVVGPVISTAS